MKSKIAPVLLSAGICSIFSVNTNISFAQAKVVIGNSSAVFMKMNGGVQATPIYLVVGETATDAIKYSDANPKVSWIISEGDFNYVQWNAGSTNASYVIPFGYSTTSYIPFTFNKTAGSTNFSASTYHTAASDNAPYAYSATTIFQGTGGTFVDDVIDRWWRINATGNTADMTFSYPAAENTLAAVNTADIQPQRWNGTFWDAPVGAGSPAVTSGVGTVGATGITNFSPWVLSRKSKPLPIELLSFAPRCDKDHVIVEWSTVTEMNNDYFTVERDKGRGVGDWEVIGTVQGAGNSSQTRYYSFIDIDPLYGTNYYRLKQTDFNGQFEYFAPAEINCADDIDIIIIFPNPAFNLINYQISVSHESAVTVKVMDVLSRNVIAQTYTIDAGVTEKEMDISSLAAGPYLLQVYTNNGLHRSQKQFVIK